MLLSAEVRWFWEGPQPELHRWFSAASPPPGGGGERVDTYLADPSQTELGIKSRGQNPWLEIKALVSEPATERLGSLTATVQIWTKISTSALLGGLPTLAIHKRRRLRKYDTTASAIRQIALGGDEQPVSGEPWPVYGCNVELTEVWLGPPSRSWTTLGFEAFGSLDRIEASLSTVIRHWESSPPPDVGTVLSLSYPQWLARLPRPA